MKTRLTERQQARSFGRSVGLVLLLTGIYQLWRGRLPLGGVMIAAGAVLAVAGTFAPGALRIPSRFWWTAARALGWVNSRILLSLFFFLVVTPVGVIRRWMGHNPLLPPGEPGERKTGWTPYTARRDDPHHYEHLF